MKGNLEKKIRGQLVLIILFSIIYMSNVNSQSMTVHQNSDYIMRFEFSGISTKIGCYLVNNPKIRANNIFTTYAKKGESTHAYDFISGPSYNNNFYIYVDYRYNDCTSPAVCGACINKDYNRTNTISNGGYYGSSPLKTPKNASATNKESDKYVRLTWEKGSDVPEGQLNYKIYRNNVHIATVAGNVYSYVDNNLAPGKSYEYSIETYTSSWGGKTSSRVKVTGSTFVINLNASAETFSDKIRLSWDDIRAFCEEIKIYRNGAEIATLSKSTQVYNDNSSDIIPGRNYTYKLLPIKDKVSYAGSTAQGSKMPNGVISGTFKSRQGAGVSGVNVTASAVIKGKTYTYNDITAADGSYKITNIFYDSVSNFKITPSKTAHGFDPNTLTKKLELSSSNNSADFIDTTVLTVIGRVYYPFKNNVHVGKKDVEILVNGKQSGIKTNEKGIFKIPIQDRGLYTFTPKWKKHAFEDSATSSKNSIQIMVEDHTYGVNFIDITVDTLTIDGHASCKAPLGEYFTVELSSPSAEGSTPLYKESFTINSKALSQSHLGENGKIKLLIPATDYKVEMSSVTVKTQNGGIVPDQNKKEYFSTPLMTDISDTSALVQFLYKNTIDVNVDGLPEKECNRYIMNQSEKIPLRLQIQETYTYDKEYTCPLDSGRIFITDEISDLQDSIIVINVTAADSLVYYKINPGYPKITGDYMKSINFQVRSANMKSEAKVIKALVLGDKPRTATFVTKTPEIPILILHDAPGDESYSFLEKGTSITNAFKVRSKIGGGAGLYGSLQWGLGVNVPFVGKTGTFVELSGQVVAGRDNTSESMLTTTITTKERFGTSGNQNLRSDEGDVYIGASLNMVYALTDKIQFDLSSCSVIDTVGLAIDFDGFATTYAYTEKHIKETILPQLKTIIRTSPDDSVKVMTQTFINAWENALARNEANRKNAKFVKNTSFSAGVPIDNSTTIDSSASSSFDVSIYVNAEVKLAFGASFGEFNSFKIGGLANFNFESAETSEFGLSKSVTTGYHLEDNDVGDFFSVDIKEDRVYKTPVFTTVSGTSSCPHEKGTQYREMPALRLDEYSKVNVPVGEPAKFIAYLSNLSESEENRIYSIKVDAASNLDGAIIKVGGEQVNSKTIEYTIPYKKEIPVVMTVERGPVAYDYDNIKLMMYSTCEIPSSNSTTASARFSVNYLSECSKVDLFAPGNNWLVNNSSNNLLNVVFYGYNSQNTKLQDIRLQYRRLTGGVAEWATAATILTDKLKEKYYNYSVDVSSWQDGDYELRAVATCTQGAGITYSPVYSGSIDRNSLVAFGLPQPADRILNKDEQISLKFNKNIDCNSNLNPPIVSLTRKQDGKEMPVTFACKDGELIITANDSILNLYEGSELVAKVSHIADVNGNTLKAPTSWSFVVNRNSVFWQPSNIVASVVQGKNLVLTGNLKNNLGVRQSYSITRSPSYLSVNEKNGQIPSQGVVSVNFNVNSNLNTGEYLDTVIANIDGVDAYLFIKLNVVKDGPDWKVNSANYQYSLNVTAQFSLTNSNEPLSIDEMDKIGVFAKDGCRGVANIQYDAVQNKYAAFITVYSNSIDDSLSFKIWDAQPGVILTAKEKIGFVPNASLGSIAAPFILHPEGVTQVIPLKAGWNWISFNVSDGNMSTRNIMKSLKPGEGDVVKSLNEDYSQYNPKLGWVGPLSKLNNSDGYMLKLSKADTLTYVGLPALVTNMKIAKGWNWIGYPNQNIHSVKEFIKYDSLKTNDRMVSQMEFATYNHSTKSWSGSLQFMKPGLGYKLHSSANDLLKVSYAREEAEEELNRRLFEENMNITAKLMNNGASISGFKYSVQAIIDDAQRGVASPQTLPESNASLLFLTVSGDKNTAGQQVSFKVTDNETGASAFATTSMPVMFSPDGIIGTVEEPLLLSFNALGTEEGTNTTYILDQNYPNPFSELTQIGFEIANSGRVTLEVYTMAGVKVAELLNKEMTTGRYAIPFHSQDLPSGIYCYKLTAGNYVKVKKLNIIK